MEHNSAADLQQQRWGWTTLLSRLSDDPKVSQLMNTRLGQYLSSRPVLALTVLVFSAFAVFPVGLFVSFALVTIIMCAVGFVFIEVFLLFVGGLSLLCVLFGIAFFSVMVSLIFNAFYITIANMLKSNYPSLIKHGNVEGKESETSKLD